MPTPEASRAALLRILRTELLRCAVVWIWTSWLAGMTKFSAVLSLAAVLGCSGATHHVGDAPPPSPSHTSPSAEFPAIEYRLPNTTPSAAFDRFCRPGTEARQEQQDGYGYDFDEARLYPLPYGPRIREMPRTGPKRTLSDLYDALARQVSHMNACYRWARHWDRIDRVQLTADFTVDQFGQIPAASVTGGGSRLDGCVKEGLLAMQVSHRTPRLTKAKVQLWFEPSGLPKPRRAPARPTATPPVLGALCIEQSKPLPVDELTHPQGFPLARFDDWSYAQSWKDSQRKSPGLRSPPRLDCTLYSFRTPPEVILRTIQSNEGVYRQCYLEALKTTSGLAGLIEVRATIGTTGLVDEVKVAGPGGKSMADCMAAAFKELVVQPAPTGGTISFLYPLRLVPRAPTPVRLKDPLANARVQLERLDADGALETFAQVIRGSAGGADECWGRLGVVQAMLVKAPWVHDPRVWEATEQFVRYVGETPEGRVPRRCLEAAGPIVSRVGTWPYQLLEPSGLRLGRVGRWESGAVGLGAAIEAVGRATRLLAMTPRLPGRLQLLEFVASGLARHKREERLIDTGEIEPDKVEAAFAELFAERLDPERVTPLLRAFAGAVAADAEGCSDRVLRPYGCPRSGPF